MPRASLKVVLRPPGALKRLYNMGVESTHETRMELKEHFDGVIGTEATLSLILT